MKKVIALMLAAAFFAAPVYAKTESSGKVLSYLEFSAAPENRGMPQRAIDRRYYEYRNGRFAVTTLDAEHIR
jgi:hypothetical protein